MLQLDLDARRFAFVRFGPDEPVPEWALSSPFLSVTRTPDELSVLCHEAKVPPSRDAQRGFRSLKVRGPLAFSEIGVLDSLAHPLAHAEIPIVVVSTYDTDYVLVDEADVEAAVRVLVAAGHTVHEARASG